MVLPPSAWPATEWIVYQSRVAEQLMERWVSAQGPEKNVNKFPAGFGELGE